VSSPSDVPDERVVGRVLKAHGVRGEFVVEPRTDNIDARFAPGAVLSVRGRRASRVGSLTVTAARRHGDRVLVSVEEVADRDGVEALRGAELTAPALAGGELLAIARPGGGEALVPFVAAIVPEVDVAGGRLVLDPPEGLLDDGAEDA
jgi:16S rRNA processing protein RimM